MSEDSLHKAFEKHVKTRAREDFKMLLCDLGTCSDELRSALESLLLGESNILSTVAWKTYLNLIIERNEDSKPQILRLVNKALELLPETINKSDTAFVDIQLLYTQLQADTDIITALSHFDFMVRRDIGTQHANVYTVWAQLILRNGENDGIDLKGAAIEVLQHGLSAKAEPADKLSAFLSQLDPDLPSPSRAASTGTSDKTARRKSVRLTKVQEESGASSSSSSKVAGTKRRPTGSLIGKLGSVKCARVVRAADYDDENSGDDTEVINRSEAVPAVKPQPVKDSDSHCTSPRSDTRAAAEPPSEGKGAIVPPSSNSNNNSNNNSSSSSNSNSSNSSNSSSSNSSNSSNSSSSSSNSSNSNIVKKAPKADLSKYVDDKLRNFDATALLKRNVASKAKESNAAKDKDKQANRKIVFARTFATKNHIPAFAGPLNTKEATGSPRVETPSTKASSATPAIAASKNESTTKTGGFSAYTSSMIDTSVLLDTSIMDTSADSAAQTTGNTATITNQGAYAIKEVDAKESSISETSRAHSESSSDDGTTRAVPSNNTAAASAAALDTSMSFNGPTAVVPLTATQQQQQTSLELLLTKPSTSHATQELQRSSVISFKKDGGLRPSNAMPAAEKRVLFAGTDTSGSADSHLSSGSSSSDSSSCGSIFDPKKDCITFQGKRYSRIGVLGKGGSSCVHRILDSNGAIFAYKKVLVNGNSEDSDSVFDSYANEINLLQRLKGSPHIIELVNAEINREDNFIAMVMEVGEVDLSKVLKDRQVNLQTKFAPQSLGSGPSPSIPQGMPFMNPHFSRMVWQEMLEAVDYMHAQRIVHGDLKPANFVFVKGHLKLIDFGIAKAISDHTTNIYRDSQIGTINYMAPEAIAPAHDIMEDSKSKMRLGRASDIWSLGCILYQIVYGRPPFAALNTIQKLHAIPNPKHTITYPPVNDMDAVDSMKACLTRNVKERVTIGGPDGLLNRPYLTVHSSQKAKQEAEPTSKIESSLENTVLSTLQALQDSGQAKLDNVDIANIVNRVRAATEHGQTEASSTNSKPKSEKRQPLRALPINISEHINSESRSKLVSAKERALSESSTSNQPSKSEKAQDMRSALEARLGEMRKFVANESILDETQDGTYQW